MQSSGLEPPLALLPAGGHSRRMGRPKLALPLGPRTVLEHVVHALRSAGVVHVLVVVGAHVPEVASLARAASAHVLMLDDDTADMRATVEHGLRWLEQRFQPSPEADWLLCPADHPLLDPALVRRLLDERRAHPSASIVVPTFGGRRGHPALIAWKHVAGMRALPPGLGLNAYLRQQTAETLEVASGDAILHDLDTPEDYEALRLEFEKKGPKM